LSKLQSKLKKLDKIKPFFKPKNMSILEKFSLKNKVIVITGATGVLGESFVKAVAEAGAKLALLGRNKERLAERLAFAESLGAQAISISVDVLDEAQVIAAKDKILSAFGRIDGLVNAAGGNIPGATIAADQDLFEINIQDTFKSIELNLHGTIIPTHVFGAVFAKQGNGAIVNISSLTANRPFTRGLGYSVAKHGIDGYTKWMAAELGLRYQGKIRINAIAPGVFLTDQNRSLITNPDGSYTDRANKIISVTPYGRLGEAQELEGTLVYLLSEASAFITGETVFVDGGFNAWSGI